MLHSSSSGLRSGSTRIHPTAVISPEAELADNVEVGAHAIIEGRVVIGPDCVIRPGAYLFGPLTMGRGNTVFPGAVLGEKPQHLRYNNEETSVEIGDGNIFRENVTVHRGTTASMKTVIGNQNFFMASSHVAHDCVIGSRCFFVNGSLVGGHCIVEDCVYMSGNSAVHQFVHVGRLAMLSGCSASTKDIPPFIIQQDFNSVVGINVVGMRRAGMTQDEITAVKHAFRLLFREAMTVPAALDRMARDLSHSAAVREMLAFMETSNRGINCMRGRREAA